MPQDRPARRVTVGVDTHKDVHVGVALDALGARLGQRVVAADRAGYGELLGWAGSWGVVAAFGVEGTGSYGAGLTRHLLAGGHRVLEVNRPDRATRRRRGKDDAIDAEAAARAVLAGTATGQPKTGAAEVEMVRMLKLTRNSAVKARTQALNQIRALIITAPGGLRESLTGLSIQALLTRCAGLRPGELSTPLAAAKLALQVLARRSLALRAEADTLTTHIRRLTEQLAPQLCAGFGLGPDTAAQLLITAGDNSARLHSEAAFAAVCGVNPVPASSGQTTRHRLNRGGDRQANAALHRIVIVRLRHHEPTRAYMTRRLAEGKTKPEIIRCLKRAVAREIYHLLPANHDLTPAA